MIRKIYFQSIFFSFLFFKEVFAAESGGMPQLNPEFWISQIFWLILTFGTLYLALSKLVLPKISDNLESRKSKILENIEAADKQREDCEVKYRAYEEFVSKSKLKAKAIFNQSREKAIKDINNKRDILDKQIDEEISKVEEEIKILRKNAHDKISKIAVETSSELIHKFLGAEVNNSSISAIVDDLSKKNGNKYYGY